MKKVMFLGAGKEQIPFIRNCKSRGAEVYVVSPSETEPAFQFADHKVYIDIKEKERLYEVAVKEGIDVVTSDQTEVAVPTVAYISEKMGLPSIGYDTSLLFTDKYKMRCKAKEVGISVPAFAEVSTLTEAVEASKKMRFPLIIKPTNSSASRGVHVIHQLEDLIANINDSIEHSRNHKAIVEEFIEGIEYGVDGFALDGNYINLDLSIKDYFNVANMCIPKMLMFSSASMVDIKEEQKVLEANKKLALGMGLSFGITHASYIYCKEDQKVYLVEIAARGGGTYISSDLTPLACGVKSNDLLLDYLIDNKVIDITKLKLTNHVSAYCCFELPEGEIVRIENMDKLMEIPGVYQCHLDDIYLGRKVDKLVDATQKQGPILLHGNSREECFRIIKEIQNTLIIETQNGDSINGIIW